MIFKYPSLKLGFLCLLLFIPFFVRSAGEKTFLDLSVFKTRDDQFLQLQWKAQGEEPFAFFIYKFNKEKQRREELVAKITNETDFYKQKYYNDILPTKEARPENYCYAVTALDEHETEIGQTTACFEEAKEVIKNSEAASKILEFSSQTEGDNLRIKMKTDKATDYRYSCSPWMPTEPPLENPPGYYNVHDFIIPSIYGYVITCTVSIYDQNGNTVERKAGPHPIGKLNIFVPKDAPAEIHAGDGQVIARFAVSGPVMFMPQALTFEIKPDASLFKSFKLREERLNYLAASEAVAAQNTIRFENFEESQEFEVVGSRETNIYAITADVSKPSEDTVINIAIEKSSQILTNEFVSFENNFPVTHKAAVKASQAPPLAETAPVETGRQTVEPSSFESVKPEAAEVSKKRMTVKTPDATPANTVRTFFAKEKKDVNQKLAKKLAGRIVLKAEGSGEAFYMHPKTAKAHYLGRPEDAFEIMRKQSLGISNEDLKKIPVAGADETGDIKLTKRLSGLILLQIEEHGEAWYVNPSDGKRYFLDRPDDAFRLMRELSLGVSDSDISKLELAF